MTFKTFGRVDLQPGVILSTRTSHRDSKAMAYICDVAKFRSVADICVSTSEGQTLLLNCVPTLLLNTQTLYPLGRHVFKYMLQCF